MTNRMLVVFMLTMPILAALAVDIGGVWVTDQLSVVGLAILAAGLVGAGLVA